MEPDSCGLDKWRVEFMSSSSMGKLIDRPLIRKSLRVIGILVCASYDFYPEAVVPKSRIAD